MKRIRLALAVLISGICVALVGANALAASWTFAFPMTITDTSNTTRTYYPVLIPSGGTALINGGYTVNGTDTNIQLGTDNVTYMLADNITGIILNSLPSGGQVPITEYTGYSPAQTGFPIITGQGGNVSVVDSVSLKHGSNFADSFTGYITDNETLISKLGSYSVTTGSGNVTATIFAPNYIAVNTSASQAYDVYWKGQTFTPSVSINITQISIYAQRQSSPLGTVTASIRATAGGVPTGGDLRSGSVDGATWSTSYSWNTITLSSPLALTGGTMYAIVLRAPSVSSPCTINWGDVTVNASYDGGTYVADGGNSGATWTSDATKDCIFDLVALTISTSYGTAGLQTVTFRNDGSHAWITTAAGSSENATAVAIPDVSYNYTIGVNVPHWTSLSMTVNGIQNLSFAPNAMIQGANIPDLSGNSNNGTINWGANVGISIKYGQVSSSSSVQPGTSSAGAGTQLPTIGMPSFWYGGATDATCVDLPFYADFHAAAASPGSIPTPTMYFLAIFGFALVMAVVIMAGVKSIFLGALTFTLILFGGSQMGGGIVPMWIPTATLIVQLGVMFLYRQIA